MLRCSRCNTESPVGTVTCPNCSSPLQNPQQQPSAAFMSAYDSQPKPKPVWPWIVGALGCVMCCCPISGAILFPVFAQARKAAQSTAALSKAKQVDLALLLYANDHANKYPDFSNPTSIGTALTRYTAVPKIEEVTGSYQWNESLSGKELESSPKAQKAWVFYSANPDPTGRYDIGFEDGHVTRVTPDSLSDITANAPESK